MAKENNEILEELEVDDEVSEKVSEEDLENDAEFQAIADEIGVVPENSEESSEEAKDEEKPKKTKKPRTTKKPSRREELEESIIDDDILIIEADQLGAETVAMLPSEQRRENFKRTKEDMVRGVVFHGIIGGVERSEDDLIEPRIITTVHDLRVVITASDFFDNFESMFDENIETSSEKERNTRIFSMCSGMIGQEIPFIVTNAKTIRTEDGNKYVITGSRKLALERRRNAYYFGETPRISNNTIVKARAIKPTKRGVWAEIAGYECFISKDELSSCKWIDPYYDYADGKAFYVQIRDLSIDSENKTIHMNPTAKPLDADEALKNFDACKVGGRYVGTVVLTSKFGYLVNLDSFNVKAMADIASLKGAGIRKGDKVLINITKKSVEKLVVHGTCMPVKRRTF